MCTFYNTLPSKSNSEGTNKKRNLVVSLKPCADEKTFYRFRILAFSSSGKNDRDYPFITRYVHQIWGKNPEKGYPMIIDEVTCPVTPHVHVEGNRYKACKICDLAGKYFGSFKQSGYSDKEAGKKNKEFSRKFQGIVPVYVVSDPNYEGNNGRFKVLIFNDKETYDMFKDRIEKETTRNRVFNGEDAVDCCIHVKDVEDVKNEGKPNQYVWKHRVIDKILFSTKPYTISAITSKACNDMGFDEEYYTTSSQDEIDAFYNKHCKISNDDIPTDDDIDVYDVPKTSTPSKSVTPIVTQNVSQETKTDDVKTDDLDDLIGTTLDQPTSKSSEEKKFEDPLAKDPDDITDSSLDDLLSGIDVS